MRSYPNKIAYAIPALFVLTKNGELQDTNSRSVRDASEYESTHDGKQEFITNDIIQYCRDHLKTELDNMYGTGLWSKSSGTINSIFPFNKTGYNEETTTSRDSTRYVMPIETLAVKSGLTINLSNSLSLTHRVLPEKITKTLNGACRVGAGVYYCRRGEPLIISNIGQSVTTGTVSYGASTAKAVLVTDFTNGATRVMVRGIDFTLDTSWDLAPGIDATYKGFNCPISNFSSQNFLFTQARVICEQDGIFELSGITASPTNTVAAGTLITVGSAPTSFTYDSVDNLLSCQKSIAKSAFEIVNSDDEALTVTCAAMVMSNGAKHGPWQTFPYSHSGQWDYDINVSNTTAAATGISRMESITNVIKEKYDAILSASVETPTEYAERYNVPYGTTYGNFMSSEFKRYIAQTHLLDIDLLAIRSVLHGYDEGSAHYWLRQNWAGSNGSPTPYNPSILTRIITDEDANYRRLLIDTASGRVFWFEVGPAAHGGLNKENLIISWIPRNRDGEEVQVLTGSGASIISKTAKESYNHYAGLATGEPTEITLGGPWPPEMHYLNNIGRKVDAHTLEYGSAGNNKLRNDPLSWGSYQGMGWWSTETANLNMRYGNDNLPVNGLPTNDGHLAVDGVNMKSLRNINENGGYSFSITLSDFKQVTKSRRPDGSVLDSDSGNIGDARTFGPYTLERPSNDNDNNFRGYLIEYIAYGYGQHTYTTFTGYESTTATFDYNYDSVGFGATIRVGSASLRVNTANSLNYVDAYEVPYTKGRWATLADIGPGPVSISFEIDDPPAAGTPQSIDASSTNPGSGKAQISDSTYHYMTGGLRIVPIWGDQSPITGEAKTDNIVDSDDDAITLSEAAYRYDMDCWQYEAVESSVISSSDCCDMKDMILQSTGDQVPTQLLLPLKYDEPLFWFGPNSLVSSSDPLDVNVTKVQGGYVMQRNTRQSMAYSTTHAFTPPLFYCMSPNQTKQFYHLGGSVSATANVNQSNGASFSSGGSEISYSTGDDYGMDYLIAYDSYQDAPGVIPIMTSGFIAGIMPSGFLSSADNNLKIAYFKGHTRNTIVNKRDVSPLWLGNSIAVGTYNPNPNSAKLILPDGSEQFMTMNCLSRNTGASNTGILTLSQPGEYTVQSDYFDDERPSQTFKAVQLTISKTTLNGTTGDSLTITNAYGVEWTPQLCENLAYFPTAPMFQSGGNQSPIIVDIPNTERLFTTTNRITWTLTIPPGFRLPVTGGRVFPNIIVGQLNDEFVFAVTKHFQIESAPVQQASGHPIEEGSEGTGSSSETPPALTLEDGEGFQMDFGEIEYEV